MKNHIILLILVLFSISGCKSPEARRPVTQSSGSYINESIQRNKEIVRKEEAKINQLIEEDTLNNYITSPNGFWYYYNKKSTDSTNTKTPNFGDEVVFDYEIEDLNGNIIYSEEELPTKRYTMDKEELFTGLREGLKLMKEGEVVTFYFPSYKAFGYYGDKNKIGTNIPIKTTVTLHSITQETSQNQNSN